MALELRTFNSGDTDYIAKLNANSAAIKAAIDNLQVIAGGAGADSAIGTGMFIGALFNNADALIGPDAYKPTPSGTSLVLAPGGAYVASTQKIAAMFSALTLSFVGQSAGTKYIVIGAAGVPTISATQDPGTVYSVGWTGSAFAGTPVRVAPAFFDTIEAEASRKSATLGHDYASLDLRLEAGEDFAKDAKDLAEDAMAKVVDVVDYVATLTPNRKVGVTVDSVTGVKGAIQIDFSGTIIGWSVIADAVGDLQVDVYRKSSAAPPAAPGIPNITTDKISASAPVALAAAQSAASGTAGVSTWDKMLTKWDVVSFTLTTVSAITRATLYLLIQETTIKEMVGAFIPSGSQADITFGPFGISQS